MSGNSHQKKVVTTAVAAAPKKMGVSPASSPPAPIQKPAPDSPKQLERGSVEAYAFFIVAGVYTVMSAFGSPVNFWAGCLMALVMAGCAAHLLWSSVWTSNWTRLAKITGTGIIAVTLLLVINSGYVQTHRAQNPNAQTLSAIQNLGALITRQQPIQMSNTQVFEVDGKYPDMELSEPRDVATPNGPPLVNVDEKNIGSAPALSKRESVGLFIAPKGVSSENAIFRYLYKREHDRGSDIPSEDLAPGPGQIMPIGGPVMTENGVEVDDADRRAVYEKTEVFYVAALVGYQGRNGRMFHKELCYFYVEPEMSSTKCTGHNGHG